jgi:hypothetical protein
VVIHFRGQHDRYATLVDYSPDRKVKPLVMNELTRLTDGGVEREYRGVVGDVLGKEYVLLIITSLPLTDEQLEEIALAPNEIELDEDENILVVAVNDFLVVQGYATPGIGLDRVVTSPVRTRDDMFIDLDEFAIYIDYPLNTYPYDPWPYLYLYPYPRFRPTAYMERYGPFTRTWYVFPTLERLKSNFWDYAWAGWIDRGIWIIPPGGYWQGKFRVDDPYADYYLRVLPFIIRENTSYMHNLRVEVNGTLLQPSIDISGAIGWGQYWTSDPFAYYNLQTLLHVGDNTIRLYWPEESESELGLQMMDVVPSEVVDEELEAAQEAATEAEEVESEEEAATEGGEETG